MIFVVQRRIRLETVKPRSVASHTCNAVTSFGCYTLYWSKHNQAHNVVSLVGVIAVCQKRVICWIICSARSGIGDHRQSDSGGRSVFEANQ